MKHKKLFFGTLILATANFLTKGMGFFNRIFLSSLIGSEGIGLYQLIMPLYTLAWSITSSGFTTTISRLTAQENLHQASGNMRRIVKQAVCICLFLSILISCALFFFSYEIAIYVLQEPRTSLSLRLLAFAIPFMAAGSCLRGYFMGLQQMLVPAFSQVLEQVLRIAGIWLLAALFVPKGLEYACFAAVCGVVLGEAGSFFFTYASYIHRKHQSICNKRPTRSQLSCMVLIVSMALPLTASKLTGSLLSTAENILIPRRLLLFGYSSADALSAYGELTGMILPLLMLPSVLLMAFSVSLVPEISAACAACQNHHIRHTVSVTLLFTSICGIGAACVFAVFPREICYIFYHRASLGQMLLPLAFLCPMLYGHTTLNGLMSGLGEQFFLFWSHILTSLVTIVFVWFGIPRYGLYAYYVGWFCSLLLDTILSLHRLYLRTGVRFPFFECFCKPLLAGGAAALCIRYIIQIGTPSELFLILCLCGMGILYILLLFLLGCFSKENIQTLLGKR